MIKFGEKFAVTLIGVITVAFFAAVFLLPTQRVSLFIPHMLSGQFRVLPVPLILLALFLYGIVSHSNIRRLFWCLYAYLEIGFMALFVVVEWPVAQLVVIGLALAAASVVTLWSRRVSAPIVFVREKPLRRAVTVFLALAVFSYCAVFHTILIFFSSFAAPLLIHFFLALSVSVGTYILWSLYYESSLREFFIPLCVIFLLTGEASIIAALGSTGYFVRAFEISLLWYVMQLFIRFHFGNRDIMWPRQRFFLVTTSLIFVVFAFLIRFL